MRNYKPKRASGCCSSAMPECRAETFCSSGFKKIQFVRFGLLSNLGGTRSWKTSSRTGRGTPGISLVRANRPSLRVIYKTLK